MNKNAPIIFDLTGVEGYKGRADQRQELFSRITKENCQKMRERIKKRSSDDTIEGSTNFGRFIEYFMTGNSEWIQLINKSLEEYTAFNNADNILRGIKECCSG